MELKKVRIYLAGPLFSLAERNFNRTLADVLEAQLPNCVVSLPQEYANTITEKEIFGDLMFDYCLSEIDRSDMIIAILDGPDVDSGTSVEIGYANAHKKPVIGVRTDFRASEDRGVNLMVSKACSDLLCLPANVTEQNRAFGEIVRAVERLLSGV